MTKVTLRLVEFVVIVLGLTLGPAIFAQTQTNITNVPVAGLPLGRELSHVLALRQRVETRKLASKLMGREMPYRVIVPPGYDALKLREPNGYPVIYLLHGLTGSHSNWTDRTKLAEYAAAHKFIIVTPEGENGWYTDSPTKSNDKYESYIVKELIPQIEKDFRVIADRKNRMIAGLSMGGYGAVKFGLKYPEMFSFVGSFSGAVGASSYRTLEELPPSLQKILVGTFGEPGGDTHTANDLFKIVSDASPQKIKAMPFIYMSCGTEDFLIQNNRDFLALLNQKKIPHEYREMPGTHNWAFWDGQVREFLAVAYRSLKN
ncbi:MAG: esterase family protein [Blastocatellia bacterium]|nr:esterase family protein [Blastocatellia bacterium]